MAGPYGYALEAIQTPKHFQVSYFFVWFPFFSLLNETYWTYRRHINRYIHRVDSTLNTNLRYCLGKSTVSRLLAEQGLPIIDADKIAREIVEPGRKANQLIRQHFGDEVFLPDGYLDRPKLGQIIFQDPEKRKILNHCTHPYVRWEMAKQAFLYWIKGADVLIFDVPLLIESKLDRFMGTTVVVFW